MFRTSDETSGGGVGRHHGGQECYGQLYISSSSISEIEEEGSNEVPTEVKELFGVREFVPMPSIREDHDSIITTSLSSSFDVVHGGEISVYVAVGKSESSMDALTWSLKRASSSTMVYLIHIFPEIRLIPSPCKLSLSISLSLISLVGKSQSQTGMQTTWTIRAIPVL